MTTDTQLLQQLTALLGRRDLTQAEMAEWFGGAADGGPYADGLFPLTDSTGYRRWVPSPARVAEALLEDASAPVTRGAVTIVQGHERKLNAFAFGVPTMMMPDGRALRPLVMSFDLRVMLGIYEDGELFAANVAELGPAIAALEAAVADLTARVRMAERQLSSSAPVLVDGRLLQPTAVSYDLYVLAGHWLDTGEAFIPALGPIANRIADHDAKLAQWSFDVPAITVGGRLLQPLSLSYDLRVLTGIWLDTGELFAPMIETRLDAIEAKADAAAEKVAPFLVLDPIDVDGRMLQPLTLSFDLYVLTGVWLDNGAVFPTPATSIGAAAQPKAPPVTWRGRLIQPTAITFDLSVVEGFYLDDGTRFVVPPFDRTVPLSTNWAIRTYSTYLAPFGTSGFSTPEDYDGRLLVHEGAFPSDSALEWRFPGSGISSSSGVWGYLFVAYGNYRGNFPPQAVLPQRIDQITTFTETYDFTYSGSQYFNLLSEHFVTSQEGESETIVAEIGFFPHLPAETIAFHNGGTLVGTWTDPDSGLDWSVRTRSSGYTTFAPPNFSDRLKGRINRGAALAWLVSKGVLQPTWWVNGTAFGVEPVNNAGAGRLRLNEWRIVLEGTNPRILP